MPKGVIKGSVNAMDKFDRIRDHILNGTELEDPKEKNLADAAQAAWPIMVKELHSTAIAKKIVKVGLAKTYGAALRLISEAEKIYGRVKEADRAGRRAMMVEILLKAIKKAQEDGQYNAVIRGAREIARIEGLYSEEGNLGNIFLELKLPEINLSSDPTVVDEEYIEIDEEQYEETLPGE